MRRKCIERAGNCLTNNRNKGGLDMTETSKTAPVKGAIEGRQVLQDIQTNIKGGK
jgi:hypothetical protein